MNDKAPEMKNELLEYQTERIELLIAEMVECCDDRKWYETKKFDLPYAEIKCLMLFSGEHYLTVKAMSQKLDVAKSRITKLVKNLMGKGLIRQINDPMDARVRLISLTSKGTALSREIRTFQSDIHQQLLLQMEPAERKNALVYVEMLRSAMEAVKEKLIQIKRQVKWGKPRKEDFSILIVNTINEQVIKGGSHVGKHRQERNRRTWNRGSKP